MLKITTQTGATGTIFELEGKLAGPWVQELEGCWQRLVIQDQLIRVVLKAVTFIDSEGRKLLAEMHRQEAELAAEEFMMKAIIEAIMRGED
jgi:ABC-type transporter Mla MlaB component